MARARCRVASPDGREWEIKHVRRIRVAETRNEPFFWTSVVATLLLGAMIVWMLWVDHYTAASYVIPVAVVWLFERGTFAIRPEIQAVTAGPPPERRAWRPTRQFVYGPIERRIVAAVREGRLEAEPKGARLVGV